MRIVYVIFYVFIKLAKKKKDCVFHKEKVMTLKQKSRSRMNSMLTKFKTNTTTHCRHNDIHLLYVYGYEFHHAC